MIHLPCVHERPALPDEVHAAQLPPGVWRVCGKSPFGKFKAFVSPCRGDDRRCGSGCPGFDGEEDCVEIECVEFGQTPPKPKRARPQPPDIKQIIQQAVGPTARVSLKTTFPGKCQSLGERLTHEAGCTSGYACQWKCDSTNPEVIAQHAGNRVVIPRDDCGKDCPGYVA
jgi:hypothetical protein